MDPNEIQLTRRLVGTASLMVALFARELFAQEAHEPTEPQTAAAAPPNIGDVQVRLTVNGKSHDLTLDARTSLLDALREHLGLTGSKKGCDHGSAAPAPFSSTVCA